MKLFKTLALRSSPGVTSEELDEAELWARTAPDPPSKAQLGVGVCVCVWSRFCNNVLDL